MKPKKRAVEALAGPPPESATITPTGSATSGAESRNTAYPTSLVKAKRVRRTRAQLAALLAAIHRINGEYQDAITIRHLFYRLVALWIISKDEKDYGNLCSLLSKWRRSGDIDYSCFVDGTRWWITPTLFDSAEAALQNTVACYRKNLWATQPHYVELWVEKDAIASILSKITSAWGVSLFVCRGFASMSSLYQAANTFRSAQEAGKQCHILYLGDWDPSGKAIDAAVARTLTKDHDVHGVEVRRLGITEEMITRLSLPTRPLKKGDKRAKGWVGECVEVDVLTPAQMKELVESAITELIEANEWLALKRVEDLERATLKSCAEWLGGNAA